MGNHSLSFEKFLLSFMLALAMALTLACGGGGGASNDNSGPVPPAAVPPAFLAQPANLVVAAGSNATFTVAASGSPTPTYQWERSSDGLNWTTISGATSASYIFTAQAGDNGARFRAKASNSAGTATSSSASLVVNNNGPISLSNGQVLSGEVVQGGGWRLYTLQVPTGATFLEVKVDLPTVDPDLYVRLGSAPTLSQSDGSSAGISAESVRINQPGAGTWFIGVYGYDPFTPSTYTITATYGGGTGTTAPVFTTQPTSRTVAPGANVTFSAVATGNPTPTYQWERSVNGTTWGAISGETGANYTLTAQSSDNGAQFRAIASNSAGTATSGAASLIVTAGSPPSTGTYGSSYYPISNGNSWQYETITATGSRYTEDFTVISASSQFGTIHYLNSAFAAGQYTDFNYQFNNHDMYTMSLANSGGVFYTYTPIQPILLPDASFGNRLTFTSAGQGSGVSQTETVDSQIIGSEVVNISLGSFNAIRIESTYTLNNSNNITKIYKIDFFAQGIGRIKSLSTTTAPTSTTIWDETKLTSYSLH